jgi:hypothetical protein
MTEPDENGTTDEAQDPLLKPGDFAEDRDDDGTLVVLAETGVEAKNHTVAAAGETVAELNPGHPPDSEVLFCAYRNQLDSTFGEGWRTRSTEYLAFTVGDRGVPVYSFPRSRLAWTEPDMAGLEGSPHDAEADESDSGEDATHEAESQDDAEDQSEN